MKFDTELMDIDAVDGFVMTTRGEAKRRERQWGEAGKLDLAGMGYC